jgi:Protein of unknown function (DUF4238)
MKTVRPTVSYTKNQHYVWRHYLDAWAKTGSFCCYSQLNNKVFPANPKGIANETYFYEIHKLTAEDSAFLEAYIACAPDQRLRDLNREFLKLTQRSFDLRDQLQHVQLRREAKDAIERELRILEKTLEERHHTGIETNNVDIIESLRRQDATFYEDNKRCVNFIHFIFNQYFRTAKMRRAITAVPRPLRGHDPRRTANLECHMYATSVSASLIQEARAYKIVFLPNATTIPFITGDQPIINLLDPHATDDLELYYPLAPALAMILSKDQKKWLTQRHSVSLLEIERYNHLIYEISEDQLYANDEAYLRSLVSLDKHLT